MERSAGILYPLTTLGSASYDFVDFLVAAGQSWWQILPIGPTDETLSPYRSSSVFAGDPALLASAEPQDAATEHESWMDDYALFAAVRRSQGHVPLAFWPDELRNPSEATLAGLRATLQAEVEAAAQQQHTFFQQWHDLKRYANGKGLRIIGDLPIYVGEDSADFWLRRSVFDVDINGRPATSAGVPPDAYSIYGQLWNEPVYDWDTSPVDVFRFWRDRLNQAATLYDGVRIDHFRAFADFYALPLDGSKVGEWRRGPGKEFVDMVREEHPDLLVIAEDLGDLSQAAKDLVVYSGFPDMKVLQFAFDSDEKSTHLPHRIGNRSICYTGTHDNDTLLGWLDSLPADELRRVREYLDIGDRQDLADTLLQAALESDAAIVIIPIQDWLGLGSEARLNTPGTEGGNNWQWRIPQGALTEELAARMRTLAEASGR